MSTLALTPPHRRVTQARAVKSEWIKFRSLRSTVATLITAIALLVGVGLIGSSVFTGDGAATNAAPGAGGSADPVSASLAGVTFAQLAFGALGVLLMAGEYSTGQIRSTLAAVPKGCPSCGPRSQSSPAWSSPPPPPPSASPSSATAVLPGAIPAWPELSPAPPPY